MERPRPPRKRPAGKGVSPIAWSASGKVPVVGIGASAGGLEALSAFLGGLPTGTGRAFVVVQHLDPTRPGLMVELLQRDTGMPVLQASDSLKVRPDHVYVIPPNRDLSILRGRLFLFEPVAPQGRRLPIDFFFNSLAEDLGEQAVGVILSGMGSDGTLGLRAIKAKGGLGLVEDPAVAGFDSMPRSAIQAGLADRVAAPAELARALAALVHGQLPRPEPEPPLSEQDRSAFGKICILLRERTGHDFSLYKKSTVYRRIERRMTIHACAGIAAYVRVLRENPQEAELLLRELLIGVTGFFRDPETWQALEEEVLPALFAAHPEGGQLRAWVAGCSTGEEAYSLAIAFQEAQRRLQPAGPFSLQVFATDLDRDAIDRARQGLFRSRSLAGLSPQRLAAWFTAEEQGHRIRKEIREMVVFAPQNLIQDPPFIRLDLLLCRNLLIYLTPELQKRLLPLFHYSLNPGGWLVLGSAESVGAHADLFAVQAGKSRLFRRQPDGPGRTLAPFPIRPSAPREALPEPPMPKSEANLQLHAEQVLLHRFSPPAVLATAAGDILYLNGRTGKYLEPAMGKANWNLFAMARDGLRAELPAAFRRALGQTEPVHLQNLRIGTNGGTQLVDLTIQLLAAPEPLRGMVMVVFADRPAEPAAKPRRKGRPLPATEARIAELELELKASQERLQGAQEEMQTSQEELKATNEELQSTNEELQSTNEELTTSKEELQSLNEELQTVNAEQQAKVEELSAANNDMKNLLDATDIATLFLDEDLNVRRFTSGATRLFKLIPGDIGRPLSDIASGLDYPGLSADAQEVLRTLAHSEKEVAATVGEAWFSARILPYRTVRNVIGGVVITFQDISRAKRLEARLREASPGEAP